MSSMQTIRGTYVGVLTRNIGDYSDYVRAVERANARFDKALAEFRDAVLDEAIAVVDVRLYEHSWNNVAKAGAVTVQDHIYRDLQSLKGGA